MRAILLALNIAMCVVPLAIAEPACYATALDGLIRFSCVETLSCEQYPIYNYSAASSFYMQGMAEAFYEESNGLPGLQIGGSWCGGVYVPQDRCITHTAFTEAVFCVADYVIP